MRKQICIRLEADVEQIVNCRASIKELDISLNFVSEVLNLAGNKVRLQILFLLKREKRLCVCDLSDILEMNVSAISQHLRKLKDRDLIYATKEAQTIFYALNKDKLATINSILDLLKKENVLI
ncbi:MULTISPECIES: ArsR/SmtB family transcription factor [Maribacter]|jgi:DNA-binding transcriptional ArsR family regulator|uniref:ArsR/SmtB family transcription factor n=1 Tax=Maribacter TaxID=252356 RepID=UPI001772CC18|nr:MULTISPECIES: metalloregulator ArsR/SmtB family transcription factor [Maribacter]HDZ06415.1 transcriptional regulator [Maribacter sp.]